jgi:hypothetical protein
VLASLQTFSVLGVFVNAIEQVCPVTVAVAVALTASLPCGPVVPLAVAMFVVVALIVVEDVSV